MRQKLSTCVASMCLLLTGCNEPAPPQQEVLRPVRSVVAGQEGVGITRSFSGISEAARAVRASFKVAGAVRALNVRVGDEVQRGDVIAQLDEAPFRLQAEQAHAALDQARANARSAASGYERARGLYANGNASRRDLDEARALNESAEAQVDAARKTLELAELNLRYTRLQAEDHCSVASVGIEADENVATTTMVATLNCGEGVNVSVAVPETLIGSLDTGMPATVNFAALGDRTLSARIVEVGVAPVAGAATFPVTLALDAPGTDLRAGLAADVTIPLPARGNAAGVTVAASALGHDHEGAFVWVVEAGPESRVATVSRRAVVPGELSSRGVQLESGVERGERVVTAGVSALREGQRVRADWN